MGSLKTWYELQRRRMNLWVVAAWTHPGRGKDGIDAGRPGLGREMSQGRRITIATDYPMGAGEASRVMKLGVLAAFR